LNYSAEIVEKLKGVVRGEIRANVPMKRFCTMKVGGPADAMLVPADSDDLAIALDMADKEKWPCVVIGAGSNVIVGDYGIEGLVVLVRGVMDDIEVKDEIVECGAGLSMNRLAHIAARNELEGLEWAVSIPGTVGGSVVCNAGAFGSEMADSVVEAKIRLAGGKIETRDKKKLGFVYRGSKVAAGAIVLEVVMELKKGERKLIEKRMKEFIEKRKSSQPLREPSAGSIFRNPKGLSAGKIIDELGMKGMRRGKAKISDIHANFIVNTGDAAAKDVIGLIREIRQIVKTKRGVLLEPEVRIIGREERA